MKTMKLGLGTAQFGLDYGVSNRSGKTNPQEAARVIAAAADVGIRILDTAAIYGDSEEVLGRILPKQHRFNIVTKLPSLLSPEDGRFDRRYAEKLLARSLASMRQASLYGLLLHRADDLLSPSGDEVMAWLQRCRDEGIVTKVGISVYAEDDVYRLTSQYPLQLLQAPVNVFDQRLVASGALRRCKEQGMEIHVRSIFLQGLLLMDGSEVPDYFHPFARHIGAYGQFVERSGYSRLEAALHYANELAEADTLVCGVNNVAQLQQLVMAANRTCRITSDEYAAYASSDPALLNPSRWSV